MRVCVDIPDRRRHNGELYKPTGEYREPKEGECYLSSKERLKEGTYNSGRRFIYKGVEE